MRASHLLSAWATVKHIRPGQVVTDEKTNETTANPQPPEILDLFGSMVTIDAMDWPVETAV
jgi:hypothetical protein